MVTASQDVTYCQNDKCSKKCWRYWKKHKFEEDKLYWFMNTCEQEEEKQNGKV